MQSHKLESGSYKVGSNIAKDRLMIELTDDCLKVSKKTKVSFTYDEGIAFVHIVLDKLGKMLLAEPDE